MPNRWEKLPDSWIALRPANAYATLCAQSDPGSVWLAVKRPLFIAFVIGCVFTLIAQDAFNPRLLASTTLCWALIPLSEVIGLLGVLWTDRHQLSLSQTSDLFFAGHTPWLVWFAAFGLIWSLQPSTTAAVFPDTQPVLFVVGTVATMLWSLYIDYCFFRFALERSRVGAIS